MSLPRRLTWVALVACIALTVGTASAGLASADATNGKGGPLTGKWSGWLAAVPAKKIKRKHITITINAAETGGTWKISGSCQGRLTLDSISYGYHHYRRHLAHGSTCKGGDVDCLMRVGANVYDAVTSHIGGPWDTSGTLRRVSSR